MKNDELRGSKEGNVYVLTVDQSDSKVNTLNSRFLPLFEEHLNFVETDPQIKGLVIISGKEDNFIAGADIGELWDLSSEKEVYELSRRGQGLFQRLRNFSKPVIAAIHGSCLGGGFELALSCSYRIGTEDSKTKLGLPEVMLGLIPGAGGTQRLPELVGLSRALPLLLSGRQISSSEAFKLGILDHLCTKEGLLSMAFAAMESGKVTPRKPMALWKPWDKFRMAQKLIFQKAKKDVLKKTKGLYPAPLGLLDSVKAGIFRKPSDGSGFEKEAQIFAELSQTPQARGLMSLHFAQNRTKKIPHSKKIQSLGVLGAGLMGSGIASVSLSRGFEVRLRDIQEKSLAQAQKAVVAQLANGLKKKAISRAESNVFLSRFVAQNGWEGFNFCDLIIEAVFEDLEVKHKVLKEAEAYLPDHGVYASNTSAIPIGRIAEASSRPDRILGMHYFSPVGKMPLLEIIVTPETSSEAKELAVGVGLKQGKTVIVVQDGPGFYTTRILAPYMDEASLLLSEGVSPEILDEAMMNFGFPVGPITLMDEVGLDVAKHVSETLGAAFGKRVSSGDSKFLSKMLAKGFLGRKTGKGFYDYTIKKRGKKNLNLEVAEFWRRASTPKISVQEIQERMIFRMINEALFCLEEGILAEPAHGDVGAVFGLGFPPFHGGPFRYVQNQGMTKFLDSFKRLEDTHGVRFSPSSLLKKGEVFYS